MPDHEQELLLEALEEIAAVARGFGLDFYDMRFEVCPAEVLYTFGAYGLPTRFTHWSFGKAYYRLKTQYDYNLSRIYELVINSDPCYAFLLEGNSLVQNKLVMAHVLAHSDFFKNNACFRQTSRQMLAIMEAHAARLRDYRFEYGNLEVERLLDAVLAIQEHVDPHAFPGEGEIKDQATAAEQDPGPYDDLWSLDGIPEQKEGNQTQAAGKKKKFPPRQEKDLLYFLANHSEALEEWERDTVSMIRDEMLYFWPQLRTKLMNEGWAAYWHARIMRELDLNEEEEIEFAKLHAGVVQPSRMSINPYYLGMKVFEDIIRRWDAPSPEERERFGRPGGQGLAKAFEVRATEDYASFLRNYLTKDLVADLDLYLYHKAGNDWVVAEKDWEKVRDNLVASHTNGGFPYIVVDEADFMGHGELYLVHCYEGLELDVRYLEKTLPSVYRLWGKAVHLETVTEGKTVLFSYDGRKNVRRVL